MTVTSIDATRTVFSVATSTRPPVRAAVGSGRGLISRLDIETGKSSNDLNRLLALVAMIVLSIFLRQRASPESKPVHAAHAQTGKSEVLWGSAAHRGLRESPILH
jgi:hypothetical protein